MSVMSHSFRYDDFERLVYGAMLLNSNFFEETFLEITAWLTWSIYSVLEEVCLDYIHRKVATFPL